MLSLKKNHNWNGNVPCPTYLTLLDQHVIAYERMDVRGLVDIIIDAFYSVIYDIMDVAINWSGRKLAWHERDYGINAVARM